MKKLTANQIKLLPTLRENYYAKNTKKALVLVALIDDYLAKKEQTKTELDAIKIAVQLYQAEQKQERMKQKQEHINSKQRTQENRNLTREKIILGACSHHVADAVICYPFLDFLRCWANGFLSERDYEFMKTRYTLKINKNSGTGIVSYILKHGDYAYELFQATNPKNDYEWKYRIHKKNSAGAYEKIRGLLVP